MDWNTEKENLRTGGDRNWWKAEPGQILIEFLSDGEEYETEWDGKILKKVRFDIKIGSEEYSWGVTKGETENSLYGQIALVGASTDKLKGIKITLVVKGTGKETTYTVLEALPLMTLKEEEVK